MNNSYCKTLDENFNQALNLMEQTFSHDELIGMLECGNIPQKQLAALKFDSIASRYDADILISNLVGQDGKIREAVSFKIKEFMQTPTLLHFFEDRAVYDIFLEAIVDINGNICRNIIDAVTCLKENNQFCEYFCPLLIEKTNCLLTKVKDFDLQDGKYKVNKEVFKLYWCLETLYHFAYKINVKDLKPILLCAKNIKDYTIREKTAKILSLGFDDNDLSLVRDELKKDENYYVRRY